MAKLTSTACRAARGILKWTVRDLAREAGVSPTTVNLLEADRPYRAETAQKIFDAFRRHGVEITNGEGTGARLLFRYAHEAEMPNGEFGVFIRWRDGDPGDLAPAGTALELAARLEAGGEQPLAEEIRRAAERAQRATASRVRTP